MDTRRTELLLSTVAEWHTAMDRWANAETPTDAEAYRQYARDLDTIVQRIRAGGPEYEAWLAETVLDGEQL